ncbi:MAG TPA: flagellar basal body P-ring protein FlgI [Syntrophales bacterium]|nr:flagellar basal body P-ring protein FlgI [Syntrophales bacterium]
MKDMHKGILTGVALVLLTAMLLPAAAGAARIKDIASIGGIRDNQLVGYGLVVGLMNTGDNIKNGFTRDTLANLLARQGLAMRDKELKANNIAAVMVTAVLPPFAKIGAKLDVMVSSLGDAKSLLGGTLLMTPLRGADGDIYAVAQGAVTIGGFLAGGNSNSGSVVGKNHTTVGYIANGALIEKQIQYDFEKSRQLTVNLFQPDFTTLNRLASTVNSRVGDVDVKLVDSGSAMITVKNSYTGSIVSLLSTIENLDVSVDAPAVVVLNEKTGTVVMGENVRISTIAVAHGNLSFQIREEYNVSQPLPYAPRGVPGQAPVEAGRGVTMGSGGQTVVTPSTQINVAEEKKSLMVVQKSVTIQDVVRGLNAMGITPRDLIQILQTIKAAGALQADLKIM